MSAKDMRLVNICPREHTVILLHSRSGSSVDVLIHEGHVFGDVLVHRGYVRHVYALLYGPRGHAHNGPLGRIASLAIQRRPGVTLATNT